MKQYNPQQIEAKWQKIWQKSDWSRAKDGAKKPKFYCLVEFPYPSGTGLHVGHLRSYSALDAVARYKRMNGFNVLYPMGWDAFGLPAENYAIKTGIQPQITTRQNIANYKKQMTKMGLSFDWSREINTTDPEYYKWTQWIFLQLFKKGLAYQKEMPVNWCPSCKIGLANEEVVAGKCERCGAVTEKKNLKQWMLKITAYADRLLSDLDSVDYSPRIREQQINWIGRSEGAEIEFRIKNEELRIKVFTTRPDTIFGATYLVVCPEHELFKNQESRIKNKAEIEKYTKNATTKSDLERTDLAKEKTGVKLEGISAINPANNKEIPIFVADYVLPHYGTGAIMAVPAHDERDFDFARKFKLPIIDVVKPKDFYKSYFMEGSFKDGLEQELTNFKYAKNKQGGFYVEFAKTQLEQHISLVKKYLKPNYWCEIVGTEKIFIFGNGEFVQVKNEEDANKAMNLCKKYYDKMAVHYSLSDMLWNCEFYHDLICFVGEGLVMNSGQFDGLLTNEFKKQIIQWLAKNKLGKKAINYKLRDWVFSRQHYWGEPIPIVHCAQCAVAKYKSQAKLTLNFYYEKFWQALENGTKTIETRALNPEEKDRYFGDAQMGDVLHCIYRDKQTKKIKEELIYKIKSQKIYTSFEEMFRDKTFLAKLDSKNCFSAKELETSYEVFGQGYVSKIKNNGLIAWDVELVASEVAVLGKDLPVKLPLLRKYQPTGTGKSPLAIVTKWVNTKCPKCGGPAKRETDTMPNWAGSSWYFLRYCDSKNDKKLADPKKLKYWLPVNLYNGGMEHTTLHLLYSRFWHKFLFDIGVVPTKEPYAERRSHGVVLAGDLQKMSKSRGNVVNPDEIIKIYGADSLRVYEMFMGPFSQMIPWSTQGLVGVRRFLERIWLLGAIWQNNAGRAPRLCSASSREIATPQPLRALARNDNDITTLLHQTIKKVSEDLEAMRFNTAVAALMILTNRLNEATEQCCHAEFISASSANAVDSGTSVALSAGSAAGMTTYAMLRRAYETLLILLAPFAPHIAEELWQKLGHKKSIFLEKWPQYDPKLIRQNTFDLVIQINGKLRDRVKAEIGITKQEAEKLARASSKGKQFLVGKQIKKVIFIRDKLINLVV